MTYVRQAKLDRYKKLLIIAIGLIIIIIPMTVGILAATGIIQKETKSSISTKNEQSKLVNIARANRSIKAGEAADIIKFEMIAVPKELAPEGVVTSAQALKGKRITSDLERNEFLQQSDLIDSTIWYEEGDRLMEHIFHDEAIPATVDVGSVVDIKLFRPKAEDVVVVSKVVVIGKVDNTLSFYLNSMEQEFLKEANTEGALYLVQYLDKTQSASMTTYYPSYEKGQTTEGGAEGFASTSMSKE